MEGGFANLRSAIRTAEGITLTDPADTGWQRRLAKLHVKQGDASRHLGDSGRK